MFVTFLCFSVRLIPNTYEMVWTYTEEYREKNLPWPSWVASITNIRHGIFCDLTDLGFGSFKIPH